MAKLAPSRNPAESAGRRRSRWKTGCRKIYFSIEANQGKVKVIALSSSFEIGMELDFLKTKSDIDTKSGLGTDGTQPHQQLGDELS